MTESRGRIELEALLEHQGWMRAMARNLVVDDATVDDVVQDAWAAALAHPPRSESSVRSWLATVVRNLSYRTYRDRERRRRREESAAKPELGPSPQDAPADHLSEQLELQRRVIDAVLSLGESHREVVLLRYYEECSSAEIARRLQIPAATIRTRLKRAMDELRGRLDRDFGDRRRWGIALLPLAHLRPSSASISAASVAATGSRVLRPTPWIGIGTLIMSHQKIAALLVVAALLAVGVHFGTNGDEAGEPAGRRPDVIAKSSTPRATVQNNPSSSEANHSSATATPAGAAAVAETVGLRLRARVVDFDDRPIVGAAVTPPAMFDPVYTNLEGRIDFATEMFRSNGTVELVVSAEGYADAYPTVWVHPGADIDLGLIRLGPAGAISGFVSDPHGSRVAGVTVQVKLPNRYRPMETTSESDGSFAFDQLPLGYLNVKASTKERVSKSQTIALTAGSTPEQIERKPSERKPIELTLHPRDTSKLCRGIVLGPDGEPYPYAQVQSSSARGAIGTSTDARGEFSFATVPGFALTLSTKARQAGVRLSAAVENVYPGAEPLVLRMEESASVDLWFVDPDGAPAAPNNLKSFRQLPGGGRTSWAADVDVLPEPGHYRLFLAPREEWIEVGAVAYGDVDLGPFLPGRVPAELTVVLEPHPTVRVRVTSAGRPVSGASVSIHKSSGDDSTWETNGFPQLWKDSTQQRHTDAEGAAALAVNLDDARDEAEPWFGIRAQAEGFAPSRSALFTLGDIQRGVEVEIELGAGGAIEGELLLPEGRDPAGCYVAASGGDGEIYHVNVTSDGRYRFEGLTVGPWLVRQYFADMLHSRIGGSDGPRWGDVEWSCEVREGETTRFDLDLRDRLTFSLEGRVSIDGGSPGPWPVQLVAADARDAIARRYYRDVALDPTGRFECSAPYLGKHRLRIAGKLADGSRLSIRDEFDLSAGANEWQLSVELAPLAGVFETQRPKRLWHQLRQGDRLVETALSVAEDGSFSGRVPRGVGQLVYRDEGVQFTHPIELGPAGVADLRLAQ